MRSGASSTGPPRTGAGAYKVWVGVSLLSSRAALAVWMNAPPNFLCGPQRQAGRPLQAADRRAGPATCLDTCEALERHLPSGGSVPNLRLQNRLLLFKQVFTDRENSQGFLYQNAFLTCSPARTVRTQADHLFCSLCAFVKLEALKMKARCHHFSLKKVAGAHDGNCFDHFSAASPV